MSQPAFRALPARSNVPLQWTFVLGWIRTAVCALVSLLAVAAGPGESDTAFAADPPAATPGAKRSAATLVIKPKKLDFGRRIVGLTSPAKIVNVSNNSGATAIAVSSIVAQPPFKK